MTARRRWRRSSLKTVRLVCQGPLRLSSIHRLAQSIPNLRTHSFVVRFSQHSVILAADVALEEDYGVLACNTHTISLADLWDESKMQHLGQDARGMPEVMVTGQFGPMGLIGMVSPDFNGRRGFLDARFMFDDRKLRRTNVPIPGSSLDSPYESLERLNLRGRSGLVSRLCCREPTPICGACGKEEAATEKYQKCSRKSKRVLPHACSTN